MAISRRRSSMPLRRPRFIPLQARGLIFPSLVPPPPPEPITQTGQFVMAMYAQSDGGGDRIQFDPDGYGIGPYEYTVQNYREAICMQADDTGGVKWVTVARPTNGSFTSTVECLPEMVASLRDGTTIMAFRQRSGASDVEFVEPDGNVKPSGFGAVPGSATYNTHIVKLSPDGYVDGYRSFGWDGTPANSLTQVFPLGGIVDVDDEHVYVHGRGRFGAVTEPAVNFGDGYTLPEPTVGSPEYGWMIKLRVSDMTIRGLFTVYTRSPSIFNATCRSMIYDVAQSPNGNKLLISGAYEIASANPGDDLIFGYPSGQPLRRGTWSNLRLCGFAGVVDPTDFSVDYVIDWVQDDSSAGDTYTLGGDIDDDGYIYFATTHPSNVTDVDYFWQREPTNYGSPPQIPGNSTNGNGAFVWASFDDLGNLYWTNKTDANYSNGDSNDMLAIDALHVPATNTVVYNLQHQNASTRTLTFPDGYGAKTAYVEHSFLIFTDAETGQIRYLEEAEKSPDLFFFTNLRRMQTWRSGPAAGQILASFAADGTSGDQITFNSGLPTEDTITLSDYDHVYTLAYNGNGILQRRRFIARFLDPGTVLRSRDIGTF